MAALLLLLLWESELRLLLLLVMVLHLLLLLLHVGHTRHGCIQSHVSACSEGEWHGEVVAKVGGREEHAITATPPTTPTTTGAAYSPSCCYTG